MKIIYRYEKTLIIVYQYIQDPQRDKGKNNISEREGRRTWERM